MRAGGDDADEALVELLMRMHSGLIRYLIGRGATPGQAENLVQDLFFKVRTAVSGFRGESSLRGWIQRLARNALFDQLRRDRRWVELDTPAEWLVARRPTIGAGSWRPPWPDWPWWSAWSGSGCRTRNPTS